MTIFSSFYNRNIKMRFSFPAITTGGGKKKKSNQLFFLNIKNAISKFVFAFNLKEKKKYINMVFEGTIRKTQWNNSF